MAATGVASSNPFSILGSDSSEDEGNTKRTDVQPVTKRREPAKETKEKVPAVTDKVRTPPYTPSTAAAASNNRRDVAGNRRGRGGADRFNERPYERPNERPNERSYERPNERPNERSYERPNERSYERSYEPEFGDGADESFRAQRQRASRGGAVSGAGVRGRGRGRGREFDRRSAGPERGMGAKREGRGQYNWGAENQDDRSGWEQVQVDEPITPMVMVDSVAVADEEQTARKETTVDDSPEIMMSFDEYKSMKDGTAMPVHHEELNGLPQLRLDSNRGRRYGRRNEGEFGRYDGSGRRTEKNTERPPPRRPLPNLDFQDSLAFPSL